MNLKVIITAAAIAIVPALAGAVSVTPDTQVVGLQQEFDFNNLAGGADYVSDTALDVDVAPFHLIEALFGSASGSLSLDVTNTGNDSNSDVQANLTLPGTDGSYTLALDGDVKASVPNGAAAQTFSFIVENGQTRTLLWTWADIPTGLNGQMSTNLTTTPVPVPAGILLMGTAVAGFGVMRRKAKKKAA